MSDHYDRRPREGYCPVCGLALTDELVPRSADLPEWVRRDATIPAPRDPTHCSGEAFFEVGCPSTDDTPTDRILPAGWAVAVDGDEMTITGPHGESFVARWRPDAR